MKLLKFTRVFLVLFMLFAAAPIWAQVKNITGKITDQQTGNSLQGVTVSLKGSTKTAITDADGNFSISVPNNAAVLRFTFVGYLANEVVIGTKSSITLSLVKDDSKLDDVVVVGYGTRKKQNVNGAISTLKAAEIEDLPVANLGSAIINRVPGVSVSFASGKPGSTTDINIRGATSFSNTLGGTSQPLYVIDGIVVNPTSNFSQSPNPDFFENIDASQIESITFLKDASAAIYGASGSKGVILITTKRGKVGKPRFSYNGYFGSTNEAVKTKTMTAYEHAKSLNDGYELNNTPLTNRFGQAELDYMKTLPDRDWHDDFWQAGKLQRHTINVSGGSDRVTFFAGGSYYKEDGNVGKIVVDKYSIRSGIDAKITDELSASFNFSSDFNHEERGTLKGANPETDDLTTRALYLTPKWVPAFINGQPTQWSGPNPPGNWSLGGMLNSGNYTRNRSQGLSVNASLEYRPAFIKGLFAKVQFAKLNRNSADKQYYPSYKVANFARWGLNNLLYRDTVVPTAPTATITNSNQISEGTTTSGSYQLIGTLGYANKFGNHDISVLVGMDQGESEGRNIFLSKFQQLVAGVDEFWAWSNDVTSIASITDAIRNPQGVQFAKRSYLGRLEYGFKNKYFVDFTGRGDASSNFAPANRWGFFGTVGLGWKISDEKFFQSIKFINYLKLRATYGVVGDDRLNNKTYVNRLTQTTGYLFGNVYTNGLDPNVYPNPDATWEKARTFNIGFDATIGNNFDLGVDLYQRYSYDMFNTLDPSQLPITTGLPSAVKNYGKQLSWGSEFTVGYRVKIGKDFGINLNANFGWSNSQVLQQYYIPGNLGLFGTNGISNIIGKDPRTYNSNNYGYIATGMLRSQADVDAILSKNPNYTIAGVKPQVGFLNYKDVNGDGKIDDNDITLMFDKTAAVIGFGITVGINYKAFKLQTNLNLTIGGKRFYDTEARKVATTTQNALSFWNDHWTPENPNATYPRADAPLARELSTFWAVNGTQSRINNMVLSYAMPKSISTRLKIPEFRVLLTGTNLWNIVNPLKYKDPYTSNFANYPTLRNISLGLNISM
jgi:TonB-dependent starch-binding outer membrane protein SusC